jgi:branched-chain amino acid transport system permease protein
MKAWGSRAVSLGVALGLCFGFEALIGGLGENYLYRMAFLAGLYVVLAVSLNIINGICGQFSLGHAAFYHVGAYIAAYSSIHWLDKSGVNPLLWVLMMIPIGAILTGLVGFVVGLPSLKLRGDYLAIVTLGFGEIIRIVTINIQEVGASYGMLGVKQIEPLWVVWFLAVVVIAVSRNLLKSAHGLSFIAVREDEVAASAMGVNVTRTKVTAFVLGSMFAGAAGVLLAHFEGFVSPDSFKMEISFIILTMVVLGGTGSITGSALAAIALFGLPEVLRELKDGDGNPLNVSASAIIATMVCVMLLVAAVKRIERTVHGKTRKRIGPYLAAIAAAAVLQFLLSLGLRQIPALANMNFEASQLRMVIFAGTLIVVMLLRPQGVLAHHEFSWELVKKVLRINRPKEASA